MSHRVKILACSASKSLATQIATCYGESLADVELQKFSDGEFGVSIKETVRGFSEILEGKHDDLPEQAFYMVGTIDEAVEKAIIATRQLAKRQQTWLRNWPNSQEVLVDNERGYLDKKILYENFLGLQ